MATPRNISTSTAAGTKLRRGRFTPAYISLLDRIAAAAPGSWVKANTNRFQDAWPPTEFRAPYDSRSLDQATADTASPTSPSCVIKAWSGCGWDDENMRAVFFGGGHANYSGNEVYAFDGTTCTWRLAYHSASLLFINNTVGFMPTGGWLDSPISSHTYSNNAWLPKAGRFITWGGNSPTATPFIVGTPQGTKVRNAGPFVLDMSQAFQGKLGGSAGTNVKRAGTPSAGVSLPGANAWKNRDWRLDHPNLTADPVLFEWATTGRSICVTEENGHDVIYFQGNHGTSKDLFRCEIVDINDYKQDIISWVGANWANNVSDSAAAYDPKRKFFFNPSFYTPEIADFIGGWDLRPGVAGKNNRYISCPAANVVGPADDRAEFIANANQDWYSSIYDERRDTFVVLSKLPAMYEVRPPANQVYSTGWSVKKIAGADKFTAMGGQDIDYLCGRFRRSKKLDVYVYVRDHFDGNVWMYKPHDWLDPRNA